MGENDEQAVEPPPPSPAGGHTSVSPEIGAGDDEESVEELMKLLEEEPTFKVRFVPYPYSSSPATSSSAYITINVGNEESCGSSFSDSESSVMASVDLGSLCAGDGECRGGACVDEARECSDLDCDGDRDDFDEALAVFIGVESI